MKDINVYIKLKLKSSFWVIPSFVELYHDLFSIQVEFKILVRVMHKDKMVKNYDKFYFKLYLYYLYKLVFFVIYKEILNSIL